MLLGFHPPVHLWCSLYVSVLENEPWSSLSAVQTCRLVTRSVFAGLSCQPGTELCVFGHVSPCSPVTQLFQSSPSPFFSSFWTIPPPIPHLGTVWPNLHHPASSASYIRSVKMRNWRETFVILRRVLGFFFWTGKLFTWTHSLKFCSFISWKLLPLRMSKL